MRRILIVINALILFLISLHVNEVSYVHRDKSLTFVFFFNTSVVFFCLVIVFFIVSLFVENKDKLLILMIYSCAIIFSSLVDVLVTSLPFLL